MAKGHDTKIILFTVLIILGFVVVFELNNLTGFRLFNLLPTCPNGAIAPNSDVKQCDKTASGEPNFPVCSPNTHYVESAGVCVANVVGSLNTTVITGNIPSGPKPSAPLIVHCSDGTNVTDIGLCPVGTHVIVPNSTSIFPVISAQNQLPILIIVVILLFILLTVLILKKKKQI